MRIFLRSDIMGLQNMMHGGFFFGVISLYLRTRNGRFFYLPIFGYVLMLVASLACSGVQVFQLQHGWEYLGMLAVPVAFSILLILNLFFLIRVKNKVGISRKPSAEKITVPGDRRLLVLTQRLKVAIYLECLYYLGYMVAVAIVRIKLAVVEETYLFQFLQGFIMSYTMSLHRAFVIGTGYSAAIKGDRRLLLIFFFANVVFALFFAINLGAKVVEGVFVKDPQGISAALLFLQIVVLLVSAYHAHSLRAYLAELIEEKEEAPVSKRQSDPLTAELRPTLLNASEDPRFSPDTQFWFKMTAYTCIGVLIVWQGESILFSYNESFFLAHDGANTSLGLGKSLEMLCHALNFGIHAVAMFVFAYYRSVGELEVFIERKNFHGLIQLSFSFMALYQFCLGVWVFLPFHSQAPEQMPVIPLPVYYFLFRFLAHFLNALCYFRTNIVLVGFMGGQTAQGLDDEETLEDESRETDQLELLNLSTLPSEEGSSRRLGKFMREVLRWEGYSNITVYLFFFGILALSAAVLAHETHVVDTYMIIGDNFHPSELGLLSVTYTVFYHFLFIVTGYGFRSVLGRNVLFLDVYRMALLSAVVVLCGYNAVMFVKLPQLESESWLVRGYNWAQILVPVGLGVISLGSFVITSVYNKKIERIGFSREATHM